MVERLKQAFGDCGDPLVFFGGLLRQRGHDQFDFLELVLANESACVATRCPGFRAETRGKSR